MAKRQQALDESELISAWMSALSHLTVSSQGVYLNKLERFIAFLDSKGVKLRKVSRLIVREFVQEQYLRGAACESAVHYIDCIRQFFVYHAEQLRVDSKIFSIHLVRKEYELMNRLGFPIKGRAGNRDASQRARTVDPEELKAFHAKFHPRG